MGSAAAYQLAKKRVKVLGIDRFSPPHTFGSTHGETRVTRKAIGEGEEYVPLTLRSYEIFREIEEESGLDLLTVTGGLIISKSNAGQELHGNKNFIQTTIETAKKYGIGHRTLTADEILKEFPQFNLEGDEIGYFENDMGFLRPENCVRANLRLAEKYGAKIRCNEKVEAMQTFPDSVRISTGKAVYQAEIAIVSAGAWVKNFIGKEQTEMFEIYRQVFYWFDVAANYEKFKTGSFPVFIWQCGRAENDFFYGFPAIGSTNGGLKIATETYSETVNPDKVNREVAANEIEEVFEKYVENRLKGVSRKCLKTAVCLYTVLPKAKFLIDYLPDNKRVVVASPCSGHGFKHSAAIGEILSELVAEGKSAIDISAFSFANFRMR